MTQPLTGKTAFLTAAGQGIGRATAIAFAAAGARVVASDINAQALATLQQDIGAACSTHLLDVTDAAAVQRVAAAVGNIQVLFNAAGMVHAGNLLECSEEDWALAFDLNVRSQFRTIKAFLPGMLAQGGGSIINVSSVAGSIKGVPNRFAYGSSKAAVIGLTKAIAADFVKTGLRCNALCPGTVDTPSLRGRIAAAADPVQAEKDFIARQPMGRLATTDDITPMVVFLLADESRFVTGQTCLVDGGVTI